MMEDVCYPFVCFLAFVQQFQYGLNFLNLFLWMCIFFSPATGAITSCQVLVKMTAHSVSHKRQFQGYKTYSTSKNIQAIPAISYHISPQFKDHVQQLHVFVRTVCKRSFVLLCLQTFFCIFNVFLCPRKFKWQLQIWWTWTPRNHPTAATASVEIFCFCFYFLDHLCLIIFLLFGHWI